MNDFVPKTKHEPQNYAKAFKLWLQDIQHAAHEEELPLGLQTFTLHATHYLNNTYTAVYLWIDAHPELAQQLLADQEYIAEYASVLPTDKTVKSWQKDIQEKVSIFQEANLIAQKLNYGAGVSDCSSQPKELMWQLQQEISSLLPKELNAETTTGGDSR